MHKNLKEFTQQFLHTFDPLGKMPKWGSSITCQDYFKPLIQKNVLLLKLTVFNSLRLTGRQHLSTYSLCMLSKPIKVASNNNNNGSKVTFILTRVCRCTLSCKKITALPSLNNCRGVHCDLQKVQNICSWVMQQGHIMNVTTYYNAWICNVNLVHLYYSLLW